MHVMSTTAITAPKRAGVLGFACHQDGADSCFIYVSG